MTTRPTTRPATRRRRLGRTVGALAVASLTFGVAACGDDDDAEPTAPDATGPVDGAPGETVPDAAPDPEGEFDESLVIGLPVDEAEQAVEDVGWVFRVAVIDGEEQALTMDLVENRVNVAVVDGVVEGVEFIG